MFLPSFSALSRTIRLVALTAGLAAPLAAQTAGTIRGRVTDALSERPIQDAQITITGTTAGAVTNANGEFVVTGVAAGTPEVVARKLGFARRARSVSVTAGSEARADFAMTQSVTQLDQVVVTGTGGSAERKTIGNAVTTLDVSDLTSKNSILNVTEVLQSKTPGVSILPGSGAPGTGGEIRIRGASSMIGYKPVVFIDGIRYNIDDLGGFSATGGGTAGLAQSTQVTSALNNLNPNDIESIEVIKGPAAATLYGAEAANGVIQIITKKGVRGQQQIRWSVRGERGVSQYNLMPEDNYTTCDAAKIAATVSATDTRPLWPGCVGQAVNAIITDNPLKRDALALRDGQVSRTSMNARGGGDRYSFYIAGDRDTEQGVFFNSDNNRTSVRSNIAFNPNDKSDFAINLNWNDGRVRLPIQDESVNGLLLSARRGLAGRRSLFTDTTAVGWRTITPVSANKYQNYTNSERLTLGGTLNYNPFSWFQNRMTIGFDNTTTQAQLLFLPGDIDVAQDADAASGANLRRTPVRKILTLDYAGTFKWNPKSSIQTTTRFGTQVVGDRSETVSATGIGIGAPDVTLVGSLTRTIGAEAFSENNSVGYYVQEQVGVNDRLYLTAAVRADDHSSFGTNFDLIVFPKFSVSYVMSDEPRFKSALEGVSISSLKLRSAWGQAGRAPTAYSAPQTYTVDRVTLGTTTGSTLRTSAYGNPDLKPERGEELEVGFDMGLLNERAGVELTYYNKTTKDMLQSISVPPSSGFISSRLTNLGSVNNKGVELSLFGTPVMRRNVSWDTRLSLATNKNELLAFNVPGKFFDAPTGQAYGTVQQHRVGYPLGGFWVTPPQRAADGSAVLTPAGAPIFDTAQTARKYLGPSVPTKELSFSNNVRLFGNLRLYALLDQKLGAFIFNAQERSRCQSANDNCSRTNNPRARFPQTAADTILFKELAVYRGASISPEWIQSADFIKLREISATIDIPSRFARRAGAQSASLSVSGRNLKIWSDYEGVDPEVNSYGGRNFARVDAYAIPQTRRFTVSFNLQY